MNIADMIKYRHNNKKNTDIIIKYRHNKYR